MYFEDQNELLRRTREVASQENGAFARFYHSALKLNDLIAPHLKKMNASEEETNLIIGHYGIMGETNNTINQLLLNIDSDLQLGTHSGQERVLRRTFLLSTLEHHESQRGRREQSDENVIAACNRIINTIGKWVDQHRSEIPRADQIRIIYQKQQFAAALDEIYGFIKDSEIFFNKHVEYRPAFESVHWCPK